jgi:hypothetical protein
MADKPEDLLQRLERLGQDGVGNYGMPICAEAAAELRRLYAENERLKNAPQQEQEPVAFTADVARTMLESGMTFHLGMPRAIVMKQMTRFYDLVCAEASLRAAAAFAIPPRREWQGLTDEEAEELEFASVDRKYGHLDVRALSRAIEAKLKEKNNG